MLVSKEKTLKPLLESENGVHLTAYLVNRGDLIDLKSQLRTVINEAYEWLHTAMSIDERKRFLEPLDSLLLDARIFKQMKGNIGLFRNSDSFRVLNIPVEVEPSCQVATSFHVKPLLRWLQIDREFLFLGVEKNSIHIYYGSQDSFKFIDTVMFPDFVPKKKFNEDEDYAWLSEKIEELTKSTKPKLFMAGEKTTLENIQLHLRYKSMVKTAVSYSFHEADIGDVCSTIRKLLKEESRKSLEKSLLEFRFAEAGNRTRKNIFQISKAVVQGKVRKLIVTDELNIFGKIDKKSGGLSIHPFDLDHEDDDILDDLAQMVLSQGGEVVIAKRDEIPKGRPILAILDDEDSMFEKSDDLQQYEDLQERFG